MGTLWEGLLLEGLLHLRFGGAYIFYLFIHLFFFFLGGGGVYYWNFTVILTGSSISLDAIFTSMKLLMSKPYFCQISIIVPLHLCRFCSDFGST